MFSVEQALTSGLLQLFAGVFVAGVATSFTPCVYPMIPITMGIFGANQAKNRLRAVGLAACYVGGIALTYTMLGLFVAFGGRSAGALLASRSFIIPLSAFLLILATSLLGLWKFHIPASIANRLSRVGGAGWIGAFFMGLVGGLIITPCTGPVLAGLLTFVALKRNVALGGGLLFTYALGIGVLFFLIAAFSMRLPKAGRWMQYIESLFGVLLVVAALYYLQPVAASLARYASPHAWFLGVNLALVVTGVLLGGIHLRYGSDMWTAVRKTVGVILLSAGLFGSLNYTTAPRGKLPWVKQEQVAKSRAKTAHKPLLIDFWAQWCLPCKQMEANVLSDPAVRRELTRFVLYKVDVTADSEEDRRKREKYQARQLPLLILFDSNGTERARIGKAIDPDTLLDLLRRVR